MVAADTLHAQTGWVLHGKTEGSRLAAEFMSSLASGRGAEMRVLPAADIRCPASAGEGFTFGGETLKTPAYVLFRAVAIPGMAGVRRALDDRGVPCVNSTASGRLMSDKAEATAMAASLGLDVPRTESLGDTPTDGVLAGALSSVGTPAVLKTVHGYGGSGVFLVASVGEARAVMAAKPGESWLVQEFLSSSWGRDTRLFMVRGEAVVAYRRESSGGDFRSNIHLGGTATVVDVPGELREPAQAFCRAVGAYSAAVDFLMTDRGWVFCEANGVPDWSGSGDAFPEATVRAILTSGPTWTRD